jgi:hypothetical protein
MESAGQDTRHRNSDQFLTAMPCGTTHVLPLARFRAPWAYMAAAWCGPIAIMLASGSTQQYDPGVQCASVGG